MIIINVHTKVTSLLQYTHLLMMAQDRAESTRGPNNGRFINQFWLNIITSIQQLERIDTRICRQKNVLANSPGDRGSIPGRVTPKTQKMVLDVSLLNTQHYKVRIKGKMEQFRERCSTLSYTSVW